MLAYVDDMLLVGNAEILEKVKNRLMKVFKITDLGECFFLLEVRLKIPVDGLFLSQPAYIKKITD